MPGLAQKLPNLQLGMQVRCLARPSAGKHCPGPTCRPQASSDAQVLLQVLDILEDWLAGRDWGYQRIDGSVGELTSLMLHLCCTENFSATLFLACCLPQPR